MIVSVHPSAILKINFSSFGMARKSVVLVIVAMIVLLVVSVLQEKIRIRETLAQKNIVLRWLIIYAGLFAVIIFGIYGPGYDASAFIYEQF